MNKNYFGNLFTGEDSGVDITSDPIDVKQQNKFSVQVIFTPDDIPAVPATTVWDNSMTAVTFTDATGAGAGRNGPSIDLTMNPPGPNPGASVIFTFIDAGNDDIQVEFTPNDGTDNGSVPVTVTSEEMVEMFNTGAIVGKTVTIVDPDDLRDNQTAVGGDGTDLNPFGSESNIFGGGSDASVDVLEGEIQVQVSNDNGRSSQTNTISITNWIDYSTPVTVDTAVATSEFVIVAPALGNWYRIIYTASSGEGTATANFSAKA